MWRRVLEIAWVLLLCGVSSTPFAWTLDPSEQAWLAAHPRIPVLIDGDWPPIDFVDGEGRHRGVAAEMLDRIGERLGVRFERRPEPDIETVLKRIETGDALLAASIVDTPERRRRMRFSRPFLDLHRKIVTRRDAHGLVSLEALRGHVIAVERGVFTYDQLRHDYPGVRLKPVADTAAALKAVSWGEADAYVGVGESAAWLIRQLGLNNLRFAADLDAPASPLAFAAPDDADGRMLIALIDEALAAIPAETRERIRAHWVVSPPFGGHGAPLISDAEKAWIAQHPVIRLGAVGDRAPIEFFENGAYQGIAADYARLLNQRLGLNLIAVPRPNREQVMAGVRGGDIDVVAAIEPLARWREQLLVTRPYLSFPVVVFTRDDSSLIRGLDDLRGSRVAVEEASEARVRLQREHPELDLLIVPDTSAAVDALALGRADALVGDVARVRAIASQRGYDQLRVVAPTPYAYRLAFGVRKDWPELRDLLDRELASVDPATRREISARWLGTHLDDAYARQAWRRLLRFLLWFVLPIVVLLTAWGLTMRHRRNQLRASEQRFEQAMEAVSEGVWEWDLRSGKRYFSPGFFRALGYADDHIPDNDADWIALIHPDDRARGLQRLEQRDDDRVARFEFRVRRADGGWAPVLAEGRVGSRDAEGRPLTRVGTLRDLSGIKSAQADIDRLSRAIEDNPLMIVITGPDTRIEYVNGRCREIMGYAPEEVVGWPARRFLSPRADAKTLASLRQALEQRRHWRGELLHRRRNGEDFWMAVSLSPIFDEHGELTHFVAADEDISERKAIEASLKRSERQLQQIIDAVPLAIVVAGLDGRIVMANPQAVREVSRGSSLVGRGMLEFYAHAADREDFVARLARDGRVIGQHVVYRTDWGEEIDGLVSAIPIQYGDQRAHLGVMVNLTERVRLEKALAEARDAAESANRLKSRFLANMSHEIRTPLNAVIGFSHLALRTALDARQRDYLEKIVASGQSVLGLIDDILDLSRIEAGRIPIERNWFRLDEVLATVSGMVALRAAEKDLELLYSVAPELPNELLGDPMRLGQIIANLIQNAIKFVDAGDILVQVYPVAVDANGARLAFVVSDSGPGIADEMLPRLFDPFTQDERADTGRTGGVGLGLAICKSLVERMEGRIEARSWPGLGASFHFELPFATRGPTPSSQSNGPFHGARALIVDDNPLATAVLTALLEARGIASECIADGERAVACFEAGGGYDLCFVDWRLPGIDGIETGTRILAQAGGAPPRLVLCSAFGHHIRDGGQGLAHWDAFLAKPFTPSQLDEVLCRLAGQGNPMPAPAPAWLARRLVGEVLLVEDNPLNRQVASELLEGMGLSVGIADSGEQAVEMLAERGWNLVLMDIEMPGIDGFEATRRIRALPERAAIPIIAMTAHAISGYRERCLASGMDDYIAKPFDPRGLFELLARYLPEMSEARRDRPAETAVALPLLPGLDCQAGFVQCGRNPALYRRLLADFRESHAQDARRLRESIAQGDAGKPTMLRLLHTLRSVAAHLGADALARCAIDIERRAREGRPTDAARLDELEQRLHEAMGSARDCDRRLGGTAPSSTKARRWDPPTIAELAGHLRAGRAEALALWERIDRDSVPEALYDGFERLGVLVRDYDFFAAARLIDALRGETGGDGQGST